MMKSFVKCLCVCLRTFVDMYVGILLGSFGVCYIISTCM